MPHDDERASVSAAPDTRLHAVIAAEIAAAGGRIGFDRFMHLALYTPGLGYYVRGAPVFGRMPADGSDFVTAPELSPLFGATLARQVAQALQATGTHEVLEFGAGAGALAGQLLDGLDALGADAARYTIVEVSTALRARQQERLARYGDRVRWVGAWPEAIAGVVVGNEVLDAMPVTLLHFDGTRWFERGVGLGADGAFTWRDVPTALRPPHAAGFPPGTTTEIHPQATAFVATLAAHLVRGAAFFVDYGFPAAEYWHPQRSGGTLVCHRGHRVDADPLADVGLKDITAHVDFTGIALAGQDAGLEVLGYTSQARFLVNCGILGLLAGAEPRATAAAQKLLAEHEMGELFKVIGFVRGGWFDAIGFAGGDRSHTL